PAMLAISLAILGAASERWFLSGLGFGLAILVRPHIAVIAATIGIWVGVTRRDWKPTALTALGSSAGLVALLAYNYWLWSAITISGGYGDVFADRFVNSSLAWFA